MAELVSLLSDGGIDPAPGRDAAEVARETNAVIYEMAKKLDALVPDEQPIGFLCECGCLAIVEVTLDDYEAAGAWLKEHQPTGQPRD